MDGGVDEPVKSANPSAPNAVATDRSQNKAGAGRLPLKTLDAFAMTASKGCTPKRRSSESSDRPAKVARCKNATAGLGSSAPKANRGQKTHDSKRDSEDVCSEVTSSCDSDKLSPQVPSKVVGPLDGYTCVLPQPDPVGVSSTIEEGLKQARPDTVFVDSEDDKDGDDAKQLNESCSSNSTSCEIRSSQQSSPMDGISTAGSGAADLGDGKKSAKKRSVASSKPWDQKHSLQEEKKEQKAAKKLEKQRRIQEGRERRKQEKQAKEAERKLKLEEKERERLDKERERLEKQQEKEERRKRRSEAEQKQLEEKRRKEDEKQKAEEEKQRQQQAQKNLMLSFFKKAADKPEQTPSKREPAAEPAAAAGGAAAAACCRFKPFQVKEGMKMAPILRECVTEERLRSLDSAIEVQGEVCLYTTELRSASFSARTCGATVPRADQDEEVRVLEVDQTGTHMCTKKRYMRAKLLQFAENHRPAYYGTWRKRSIAVRPRRPFACDERLLNYEIDSDEEWDEEEPGESTSVKDDDEEDDEGNEEGEEMDPELRSEGFLVEHGYLSDGEGANAEAEEEEDGSLEQRKEKQRLLNRLDWEQRKRRQRARDQLKAIVIGCFYDDGSREAALRKAGELDTLRQYQAVLYASAPVATALCNPDLLPPPADDDDGREAGATPGRDGSASEKKGGSSALARRSGGGSGLRRGRECQAIPEEAMPDLVWLVHGNVLGLQKIIKEFVGYWKHRVSSESIPLAAAAAAALSPSDETVGRSCAAAAELLASASGLAGSSHLSLAAAAGASPPTQSATGSCPPPTDPSPGRGGASAAAAAYLPAAEETGRAAMSKRQLGMRIRSMAVLEKRAEYHRACWYVNEDTIGRYFGGSGEQQLRSRSELSVPTTWKYVTRQQQTPSAGRPPKESKAKGAAAAATGEHAASGRRGLICATPQQPTLHLSEPDDGGVTIKSAAGPTPRKSSPSSTPGGLTPITNFTAAKICQPRRIVPTAVSAATDAAATRHSDDGSKLTDGVVGYNLPTGDAKSSTAVPPQSISLGPSPSSKDAPKSRRVTLTTLYAAHTDLTPTTLAKTSGPPEPTSCPEASPVFSSTSIPAADTGAAADKGTAPAADQGAVALTMLLPSSDFEATEVKAAPAMHSAAGGVEAVAASLSPCPSAALGDAFASSPKSLGAQHPGPTECLVHGAAQLHSKPSQAMGGGQDTWAQAAPLQPPPPSVAAGSSPGGAALCGDGRCSDAPFAADVDQCRDGAIVVDLTEPAQGRCTVDSLSAGKCSGEAGLARPSIHEPSDVAGSCRLTESVAVNGAANYSAKTASDVVVVSDDDSTL